MTEPAEMNEDHIIVKCIADLVLRKQITFAQGSDMARAVGYRAGYKSGFVVGYDTGVAVLNAHIVRGLALLQSHGFIAAVSCPETHGGAN